MPKNRINFTNDFVLNDSKIGIGITNPTQLLQVGIGTSAVVVTSLGNLGIGTELPIQKFQVNATSSVIPSVVSTATSIGITTTFLVGIITSGITPGMEIQSVSGIISEGTLVSSLGSLRVNLSTPTLNAGIQTNVDLTFGLRNDAKVVVNSLGYVGIGTTNPFAFLDVTGNVRITSVGSTSGENIIASHTRYNGGSLVYQNQTSVGSSTGNVLFAVTNQPDSANPDLIYVISDSNARPLLSVSNSGVTTISSARVGTSLTVGTFIQTPIVSFLSAGAATTSQIVARHYTNNQGSLVFERGNASPLGGGTGNQQIFTITSDDTEGLIYAINDSNARTTFAVATSGNVGVGTTNPLQRLDVRGNVLVAAGTSTGQHITLRPVGFGTRPSEPTTESLSYERLYSGLSTTNTFPVPLMGMDGDYENIFNVNSIHPNLSIIRIKNDGKLGFGITNPSTRFDVNLNANFRSSVGIGTTIPRQTLDLIGTALFSAVGASSAETYTLRPYSVGVTSTAPIRGALNYESDVDGSTKSGGKLVEISNDNTNLFTVNAFRTTTLGFDLNNLPFFPAINVTRIGNIGIATNNPVQRVQINSQNDYISTLVSTASTVGVTTTIITGISTFGITTGLEIQALDGIIAAGTTVTSIGTNQIGIGRSSVNVGIANTVSLTFGVRNDSRVITITSNGSVGIGTTNPLTGSELDVYGPVVLSSNVSTAVTSKIRLSSIARDNGTFDISGLVGTAQTNYGNQLLTVNSLKQGNLFAITDWISVTGITTYLGISTGGVTSIDNVSVGRSTANSFYSHTLYNRLNVRSPFSTSTNYVFVTPKTLDNGAISFNAPVGAAQTNQETQIFSITNNLTSSIFRVNDINRNPIFEASASGNVGIGLTLPTTKFQVNAGNDLIPSIVALASTIGITTTIITGITTTGITTGLAIREVEGIIRTGTTVVSIGSSQIGIGTASLNTGVQNNINLTFGIRNDTRVVAITSTGNVGLGSTNPQVKLDVYGVTRISSVGSTPGEQIDIRHYRNIAPIGVATDNKGGLSFDSANGVLLDGRNYAASLFSITNDPTGNVFSVAGYDRLKFANDPRVVAFDVTQSGNVGVGTTNPITKLDVIGNTTIAGVARVTSTNSTSAQQIDLKHFRPGTTGITSTAGLPSRGSLVFDGTWNTISNTSTDTSGGQLLTILNDNTSLLSVNRPIGFSTFNPPPTGTRFIESVLEVTGTGNIGIGTTLPVNRVEINSRNQFVSSIVSYASSIGISTTLITGINTTGISVGLEIQGFTGVIATGTTVTSIGSSTIGIGRTTLNNYIRTTSTPLTFGTRTNDRVVAITSEGFVGIRTTNPIQPFQVGSAGTSVVVVNSSGNLGVGTTNPIRKVHILGDFLVAAGSSTSQHIVERAYEYENGVLSWEASAGSLFTLKNNLTSGSLFSINDISAIPIFDIDANRTVVLTPFTGNVGVGTTNPTSKLHIVGNSIIAGNLGIGTTNPIQPLQVGTESSVVVIDSMGELGIGTTNPVQKLQVGSGTSIFVVDSFGKVGVGTTNPLQSLHINGNVLVSAGTSTGQHITQRPYELSGGTLSWEGSAGQLFSIVNNLTTGSIFSVNDVSGIPSIDVNADGTIQLAPYADGNVGIATTRPTSRLHVVGDTLITGITTINNVLNATDTRLNSSSEKSTIVNGNTVSLVYNAGGGNVAVCTNPSGPITLDVTGIPTDSTFNNRVLSFSVIVNQGATGYACSTITLNGLSRTIMWPGAVVAVGATSSYDVFNFTGINTVGSASTTANYTVFGVLNGNFK